MIKSAYDLDSFACGMQLQQVFKDFSKDVYKIVNDTCFNRDSPAVESSGTECASEFQFIDVLIHLFSLHKSLVRLTPSHCTLLQ